MGRMRLEAAEAATLRREWVRLSACLFLLSCLLLAPAVVAQENPDGVRLHVVKRGENLTEISQLYRVSLSELREWNRLRGSRILVGQELRIPGSNREWITVQSGDTLGAIARRFDVSLALLRQVNDLKGDRIYPGQKLKLQPSHGDEATHVVQRGETLSEIASQHRLSLRQLRSINGIRGDVIQVGQTLRLREASSGTHIVERGDALWEIARAYGMSVKDLKAWNGLRNNRIYPGQELKVREPDAAPRLANYRVQRGDSLGEIAQLHQMSLSQLRRVNGLKSSVIHPGQDLLVSPILGGGGTGGSTQSLGLLNPDEIPWKELAPTLKAMPAIAVENGPYFFTSPAAGVQRSRRYLEESDHRPYPTYRQARQLWEAFAAKVDRLGRLSHALDGWHIVLDPGHGGIDPGTIVESVDGNGKPIYVVEDEYVYDIALRMYVLLTLHGADVTLTLLSPNHLIRGNAPATATFVHERNEVFNSASVNRKNNAKAWPKGGKTGLSRRRGIASESFQGAPRGRRIFMSLHADHSPNTPEGVTVFYQEDRRGREKASNNFARALLPALGAGARNRGRNLGVLRGNVADVKVLVEVRNLAYADQAWALRFEKLRQRDAEKLVKGILDWAARTSG